MVKVSLMQMTVTQSNPYGHPSIRFPLLLNLRRYRGSDTQNPRMTTPSCRFL